MASQRTVYIFFKRLAGKAVLLFATASFLQDVYAQDQTNFTHFFINPYVLNASYAGMDGRPAAAFIYRRQWMTIDGAPTIANLSLHAPLSSRVAAGVNINNDSKGFFNNSTLLVSAAYHVPVQAYSFVRFGLSIGGSWNTVDMQKLEGISDPALGDALDNNASLAGNAGVSFHHRTFNFGISLPTLFSPSYVSEDAFNVKEVKPFQAMVIHGTNRFYFNNNKNIFEPYLLYHLNMDLPSQFELAGIVHMNHLVWAGASYKQHFGISGLGGLKLKNALAIGASYTIQQSGYDELNSPSFEVSVNYLFGKNRKDANVYSFVNAVKPREGRVATAQRTSGWRQKQVEAERQRREEAAKVRAEQEEKRVQAAAEAKAKREQAAAEAQAKKERAAAEALTRREQSANNVQAKNDPPVQQAPTKVTPQTTERQAQQQQPQPPAAVIAQKQTPPTDAPAQQPVAIAEEPVVSPVREVPAAPQPKVAGRTPVAQPPTERNERQEQPPIETPAAEVIRQPSAPDDVRREQEQVQAPAPATQPASARAEAVTKEVRHEIVKRGDHAQELPASEYVVLGVFKSIGNARHFSDGLRNLGYETKQGYLSAKELWYVYLMKTNDPEKAKVEQQRVSKIFLLRDAWLLTVQD